MPFTWALQLDDAVHGSFTTVWTGAVAAAATVDSRPVTAAVGWLEDLALSGLATTIAVVAVAMIGFFMMTGRLATRRAVQVAVGCFIIFGASSIANGVLRAVAGSAPGADSTAENMPSPPSPLPQFQPQPQPQASATPSYVDPYAGAAVPQRN